MVLSQDEGKARRREGMDRMPVADRVRMELSGGRPPASELKTPLAAVTAARTLHRELETRMKAGGIDPKPGDWAVSIGYVTADLSALGFTRLFVPGEESGLIAMLDGHIMLGLIFGMKRGDGAIVMGTRPFLATKQTDAWLSELLTPVQLEMEDPR